MVRRDSRFISLAVSGCLLLLLAACDPFGSATSGPTPPASTGGRIVTPGTSGRTSTPTAGGATSTPTTAPMPVTQTACPPAGTARAAVFAPLVGGSHQNIVYIFNQGTYPNYTGEIKRYDASTGKKVIIATSPTGSIDTAQISTDGQWILFRTLLPTGAVLQLVRMDGQGLQTLFCSPGVNNIVWSPDQKTVAFINANNEVELLDLATGQLQVELAGLVGTTSDGSAPSWLDTWLDDTHIYITSAPNLPGYSQDNLYVLDTAKGANQQVSDLIKVINFSGFCLSFASSVDDAKLFFSTCHEISAPNTNIQQGPSTIMAEPALGGSQTTVYNTPTLAITTVRVISRTTMLLFIQNYSGDTSHNGLWKMNLDGTGLTRLTTDGAGQSSLNETSQFPWSNVSRDGSLYALKISTSNGPTQATQSLLIGSLGGASPSTFATVSGPTSSAGTVDIVGWTTM
jgi:eukaryotic-like serine/threonine-protein kinase